MKTFINIGIFAAMLLPAPSLCSVLNDPKRATTDYKIEEIYEKQEGDGYSVAYHLEFKGGGDMPGYLLNLIFENRSASAIEIVPEAYVIDRNGQSVGSASRSGSLWMAERLAGTEAPDIGLSGNGSSFGDSFANGYALGAAIGAKKRQDRGYYMLRLLEKDWLQPSYSLKRGGIVLGRLFFDSKKKPSLPMKVVVLINGISHEFMTRK